jgi:hypothetical protein
MPLGFSNALVVAKAGLVFAGSVPTSDPGGTMAEPGALLVLDHKGNLVTQLTNPDKINGPWGMAINDKEDRAQLFVSNVLDGTITRLEVSFAHNSFSVVGTPLSIAHGYAFGPDTSAVVVGPAGLAYDKMRDILYVASELDNKIFALNGAGKTSTDLGTGTVVFSDSTHLRGPFGADTRHQRRLDNRQCRSLEHHSHYCRDERNRGVYPARQFCSDVLDRLRCRQCVCDQRIDPNWLYPVIIRR